MVGVSIEKYETGSRGSARNAGIVTNCRSQRYRDLRAIRA